MANMSYCRFSNTVGDLNDCYQAETMNQPQSLSPAEQKARLRLIKLACRIAQDYGSEVGMAMEPADDVEDD